MPRRCSICSHDKTKQINQAVTDGQSFRKISQQCGISYDAIYRHSVNCLKSDVFAIDGQSRSEQIVDVKKRFMVNLRKAERFSDAAEKWLDVNGEIELDARAHEIEVIYYDPADKTAVKWPKQRKATLQHLLDSLEASGKIEPDRVTVKIMDPRKFALDALDKTDMCLNRFAMIFGEYTQEKTNPTDIKALAEEIAASLIREGHPADQVQAEVSKLFPQLVSEAVN